ncbi:Stp1/IreP family PP2C-type Ser/Thr phosphatase [Marinilactibacillus sp. GCM10026970]|uniref:Stp1/IreP family PP2C-type Ser/Thr phosphatase n=1 Tax=Marinilactibacillus sp. GCM10026970 TaxID=3252642 RepID=UPI00361B3C0A
MNITTRSNIGKRDSNQDYVSTFVNADNQALAVLCDGMGGHNAGDIASEMAVLQLGNSWEQSDFKNKDIKAVEDWFQNHINEENKRIYDAANIFKDLQGMGTTLVAAAVFEEMTVIANIGDSRAYIVEETSITRITEDHSFANELKMTGQITEEEALTHEKRNTLTRSLGVRSEVKIDFFSFSNSGKQLLLLCSDGLTNAVSEKDILSTVSKNKSDASKADELIEKALKNGATDNITVCLLDLAPQSLGLEHTVEKKEGN